jgi:L-histidine N-alpha-methyltransferase
MHLEALRDVRVESPHLNEHILISKGERIHTENSHKFNRTHLKEISEGSGLYIREIHSDDQDWFALVEFEKR